MSRKIIFAFITIYCLAAGLGFFAAGDDRQSGTAEAATYILQGNSTEAVVAAVQSVHGRITHEFTSISAVAATLTVGQRDDLLVNPAVIAINEDAVARTVAGGSAPPVSLANPDSAAATHADL